MTARDSHWLRLCRRLRPDLSDAQFESLVPTFLSLKREMVAARRRGTPS